jgi:hypothetical protein
MLLSLTIPKLLPRSHGCPETVLILCKACPRESWLHIHFAEWAHLSRHVSFMQTDGLISEPNVLCAVFDLRAQVAQQWKAYTS